ncbi:4-hydroxybenzoate octaprenyltransferase [Gammaproteobacteria bacterium]|nr:4-hydroxybenzoate octaprenyltransferase [Gammaproteobacteria bacterium]
MISRNKLKSYIEIARIDKPIGIYLLLWPSVLGLLIAGTINEIKIIDLLIVIIGSILVRSCGCVINDISDYKIDKLVSRTVGRPLATGALSVYEAWGFFLLLGLMSLSLLFFTNPLTIKIGIFFALFIIVYPLTKRFFKAPQFFLGVTFGSGSLISYSLVSSSLSLSIIILYIGLIAWIISFDTYYALEDIEDDRSIGINSTAILWGDNVIKIARLLHLLFYVSILVIAILNSFSYYFFFVFIVLFLIFMYQKKLLDNDKFLEAFKINNWIGMLAVIGFTIEIIILN